MRPFILLHYQRYVLVINSIYFYIKDNIVKLYGFQPQKP